MGHLEHVNRHVANFEQTVEDQLEQHELAFKEVGDHSTTVALSHNQVTDHVNYLLDMVDKMKQSWDNWAEWTPIDHEEEELGQEAQLPIREQPILVHQATSVDTSRTLLDVTPVYTPVQDTRDIQSIPINPKMMGAAERVSENVRKAPGTVHCL